MWWRASFDQPVPAGRLADGSSLSDLASVKFNASEMCMLHMDWNIHFGVFWFRSLYQWQKWSNNYGGNLSDSQVADVSNDPDDESITIIFNVGNYLPVDTTWYHRSLEFSVLGWCLPEPIDWHELWFIRNARNGMTSAAVATTDAVMFLCRKRYGFPD